MKMIKSESEIGWCKPAVSWLQKLAELGPDVAKLSKSHHQTWTFYKEADKEKVS